MNRMRERARALHPSLLLTLLSMVQALALELLWSRLRESGFLWAGGWPAAIGWAQVVVVSLGIIQIWLFQVSSVLRFELVPSIRDSILPFVVGALEFTLVDLIGPDHIDAWLFGFGLVFALSIWTSYSTIRRARAEPANAETFAGLDSDGGRSFVPALIAIGTIWLFGLIVMLSEDRSALAFVTIVLTGAMLCHQLDVTRRFWNQGLEEETSETDAQS